VNPAHRQGAHALRHDWAAPGADAVAAGCDVAVVVDVLSFTTTLSVAADAGIAVLPYRWGDDTAGGFARERGATLAVSRSAATAGQISLSPSSVRTAARRPSRLVLPSPNGSTIAHRLASSGATVVGVCLRNTTAAAAWISATHRPGAASIAVVSAGERWPDGSLRPCVEDWWGAGALFAALRARGWQDLSPEAAAAEAAYLGVRHHLPAALHACASGQELAAAGFSDDVDVAGEVDASSSVPVLVAGAFVPVADDRVADDRAAGD
jgi:2-phosphosulfolactate phosphatase